MDPQSNTTFAARSNSRSPPRRKDRGFFHFRAPKSLPSQQPVLKQGSYPTYRLKWVRLKTFLQRKFPSHEFGEARVSQDRYIFDLPESLKSEDFTEIEKERDDNDENGQSPRADSEEPV